MTPPDPQQVTEIAGRREAGGTFACPICGQETPHGHSQVVIDAYQRKRTWPQPAEFSSRLHAQFQAKTWREYAGSELRQRLWGVDRDYCLSRARNALQWLARNRNFIQGNHHD